MNTTEKDIELFDSYMNGSLSDTEKAQFEERLRNDEAYRKEYELHSQLALGIQRKELKAMFQEQEKEGQKPMRRGLVIKLSPVLALAACLFIGIIIVHDALKMASLGGDYIAQMELPVPRGSGVEESLSLIYDDLQQGNFDEAQKNIDEVRQFVEEERSVQFSFLTAEAAEEYEYHQQMLKLDSDELDWYQALLYAKTHKVFKAKKLLKQIAGSDSRYKNDAMQWLD